MRRRRQLLLGGRGTTRELERRPGLTSWKCVSAFQPAEMERFNSYFLEAQRDAAACSANNLLQPGVDDRPAREWCPPGRAVWPVNSCVYRNLYLHGTEADGPARRREVVGGGVGERTWREVARREAEAEGRV